MVGGLKPKLGDMKKEATGYLTLLNQLIGSSPID